MGEIIDLSQHFAFKKDTNEFFRRFPEMKIIKEEIEAKLMAAGPSKQVLLDILVKDKTSQLTHHMQQLREFFFTVFNL